MGWFVGYDNRLGPALQVAADCIARCFAALKESPQFYNEIDCWVFIALFRRSNL